MAEGWSGTLRSVSDTAQFHPCINTSHSSSLEPPKNWTGCRSTSFSRRVREVAVSPWRATLDSLRVVGFFVLVGEFGEEADGVADAKFAAEAARGADSLTWPKKAGFG